MRRKIGGVAIVFGVLLTGAAETTAKELKIKTDEVVIHNDGSVETKEMTQAEKELQECLQGSIADFREIYDTEKEAMIEARHMCNEEITIPTDDKETAERLKKATLENEKATKALAETEKRLAEATKREKEAFAELKMLTAYEDALSSFNYRHLAKLPKYAKIDE
jgi:cell division protein FtsB